MCVSVYSMGINQYLKSKNGKFSNSLSLSNLQIEIKNTNDLKNIPLNHVRKVVVERKRDTIMPRHHMKAPMSQILPSPAA